MSLKLGKNFDRKYSMRIPIMDGYYNISIFFDKKSTFLLFKVDPDFSNSVYQKNLKINMFKNLEQSKFCETFISLHNYKKNTLDILNQFDKIRDEYLHDISFLMNESIILSKIELDDRDVFDTLNIYGFCINAYSDEFIFILTERHSLIKRLQKKMVRTSGLQIASTSALDLLDEYNVERKNTSRGSKEGFAINTDSNKRIKFSDEEIEATNNDSA